MGLALPAVGLLFRRRLRRLDDRSSIATRLFGRDRREGVLAGVSSAFANNVFIGLPLVDRTVGPDGIVAMSILLAIHLPLMMIIGPC